MKIKRSAFCAVLIAYQAAAASDVGVHVERFPNGSKKVEYQFKTSPENSHQRIRDGWYRRYDTEGVLRAKETFRNGIKEGLQVWYREDGKVDREGTYVGGKRHGTYKVYYRSGQLRSRGTYERGKLEGEFLVYYVNGRVKAQGTYKGGKRHGTYSQYGEDGQIERADFYQHGDLEIR